MLHTVARLLHAAVLHEASGADCRLDIGRDLRVLTRAGDGERATGIEPAFSAWEALEGISCDLAKGTNYQFNPFHT